MAQFILKVYFFPVVILIVSLHSCLAAREISGLLDEAEGLSNAEISALKPLFDELQLQYDFVVSQAPEKLHLSDDNFEQQYEATLREFEEEFSKILPPKSIITCNTSLPSLEEIIGQPDLRLMSQDQRLELFDLQQILQDTLDDTQTNLNELMAHALQLETNLLKSKKQKVVTLIFKAIRMSYKAAGRLGRAAYCTYSHIPQLKVALQSVYAGVDCYKHAELLLQKIQNEACNAVKTIRKNTYALAALYYKVAKRNSLTGKIITIIMNISNISRGTLETIQMAKHVLDGIENQLPAATDEVISCGSNVAPQIPFVVETVSNVTECLRYKEETTNHYDFLKSEEEYNRSIHIDLPDTTENEEDDVTNVV